jgi:hypothetical protein
MSSQSYFPAIVSRKNMSCNIRLQGDRSQATPLCKKWAQYEQPLISASPDRMVEYESSTQYQMADSMPRFAVVV